MASPVVVTLDRNGETLVRNRPSLVVSIRKDELKDRDATLDRLSALLGMPRPEIEDRLNKLRSPFRSAETFWIEDIVDPRETRPLLCEFANLTARLRRPGPSVHPMRP